MALLKWDDEEDKQNDELSSVPTVKTVTSVQSGSWQPTQDDSGATGQPRQTSYLLSEEKAQFDADQRQKAAIEEQNRIAVAEQAEATRRAQAAEAAKAVQPAQKATSKYTPVKESDKGLLGFVKGVGATIQQGVGALGDIALGGGQIVDYAGRRLRGQNDEQAAIASTQATAKVRAILHGQKDITGNEIVGTRDVDQNAADIASGRGDAQDYAAVGGKGLQAGIDSTMLFNPTRLAAKGLTPVTQGASVVSNLINNPAVRFAARDAGFFGGSQGVATTASVYGETGDIGEALKAGASDAVIGGLLQGGLELGANGANVAARKAISGLRRTNELTPAGDAFVPQVQNPVPDSAPVDGNVTFENATTPPAQVTPVTETYTPVENSVEKPAPSMRLFDYEDAPLTSGEQRALDELEANQVDTDYEAAHNELRELANEAGQPELYQKVMKAISDGDMSQAEALAYMKQGLAGMRDSGINAQIKGVTPVADGVPLASSAIPENVGNVPTVKSEQLQLQESRAGTSQADEAAINQKLKEAEADTPTIKSDDDPDIEEFNRQASARRSVGERLGEIGRNRGYTPVSGEFLVPSKRSERLNLDEMPSAQVGRDGKYKLTEQDARIALREAGYAQDEIKAILNDTRRGNNNKKSHDVERVEAAVARFEAGVDKKFNQVRGDEFERAGIQEDDTYDARLQKIDDAYENGKITEEEFSRMEDEMFNRANQRGEAMAEDSVPDMEVPTNGKLTPAEFSERFAPKLADSKDVKTQIANAVGMSKDVESPIREILKEGNATPKQAERTANLFDRFEKQLQEYNRLTEINQKGFAENGVDGISEDVAKQNRRAGRELGITTRRLEHEIKRLGLKGDLKARFMSGVQDAIGTRNASVLTSAGLLERNIFQEITANTKLAIKNPIKMAKSTFNQGNIVKDTAKAELSHWGDVPRSPMEVVKYVVGNTYRTLMIPTTALANTRRGAVRQEFTKWAYDALQGGELSAADAKKLSGIAGNEMEALVNTFTGVDNGMTNRGQATAAMKAWKEYMKLGDQPIVVDGVGTTTKADYLNRVETHSSLADQMIAGASGINAMRLRALKAVGDLIFPFVRTAKNLAVNAVKQDLNPMAKSLLDEIRADQRGGGENAINLIKSKLVDYGIMGGAAALAGAGLLVYNDGDEVDKPRGWSLQVSDDTYIPVRSTSLELPVAMAGTAQAITRDIVAGTPRDWQYYAGMITGSLPYIDQFNTTTGAVDSLMSGEDAGYAAKAYGVNMAKGFVPWTNNGLQAYVEGKQGKSLNAKSVYDDNMFTWLGNTIRKSYDPDFYNSLKDSRDNAGRVRTVDNQGIVSNKDINDANTATYNDTITDLVTYGRENGLGKATEDMFNTYDTGKNNNFKSVQDSITFLDAVDGKPDDTKKLEKNAKLTDLSQQIRNGFFGDTGDELLTLNGENLYSDVSVPNSAGSKNSRLPISMQSIKNAIAQTDLPEAERNRIYEISQGDTALYNQLKNKEISYEQYTAEKAKTGQEYINILSSSESYKKMLGLMDELDQTGFFEADGIGSTRSGQTYLWNALNALLGAKGATPAANYPEADKGWGSGGGGDGINATNKPGDRKNTGIQWTPVGKRQQAEVKQAKYTPLSIKVKLGNEVKKNKTQNYSDRSF